MNNQERRQAFFDKTVDHLRKQGKRSLRETGYVDYLNCAYRSTEGLSCAIGCHIPDPFYSPNCEGIGVKALAERHFLRGMIHPSRRFPLPVSLSHAKSPPGFQDWWDDIYEILGSELASSLQSVHDSVSSWDPRGFGFVGEDKLREVAEIEGLTYRAHNRY